MTKTSSGSTRWITATAAALLALAPAVVADDGPPVALESYHRAREVVHRAAEALGGIERLRALETVRVAGKGALPARYQSATPEPPYQEVEVEWTLVADLANDFVAVDQRYVFPAASFTTRQGTGPEGGFLANLEQGVVREDPAAGLVDFERMVRRVPHLVVRDALEREEELRWLGRAEREGRSLDVVSFRLLGERELALYVDQDGRLARHEFLIDDLVAGDEVVAAEFGRWRGGDGEEGEDRIPVAWEQVEAGFALGAQPYSVYELDGPVDAALFLPPEGRGPEEGAPPEAPGAPAADVAEPEEARELADGVFLLPDLPGGADYHSLAIDLGDRFLVVEAPVGVEAGREILRRLDRLEPGKPVAAVVATHHHGDHSGGLPALAEAGVAVVTTPGNEAFFRRLLAARRTLVPGAPVEGVEGELVLVEGERVFRGAGDRAGREVRVVDVGPTEHAREMLVAWLPAEGLLFQGDLVRFGADGRPEPLRPWGYRLLEAFDGEPVETVAGVHGAPGSWEALVAAAREGDGAGD